MAKLHTIFLLILCLLQIDLYASSIHRQAALVVDAKTGDVLHSSNHKKKLHPASLTKLMNLYLIFGALESGKLTLNQKLPISKLAASRPKSHLGLVEGDTITVDDVIKSLIIKSANDSAYVSAEAIGGNKHNFVSKMNLTARKLGMNHTKFSNPDGWHDENQVSSATDMAKLALAIIKHYPKYYHYFAKTSFIYKNRLITGHNNVMHRFAGAEGLKTGYVNASGFNIVTTAKRNDKRIIGVVFGGNTAKARDDNMISILNKSFAKLGCTKSMISGSPLEIEKTTSVFSIIDKPRAVARITKQILAKELNMSKRLPLTKTISKNKSKLQRTKKIK